MRKRYCMKFHIVYTKSFDPGYIIIKLFNKVIYTCTIKRNYFWGKV